MPIYEYRCRECGHEFEELVRTSGQKVRCGKCESARVERRLSTFAAVVSRSSGCEARHECPQGSRCSGGACPGIEEG